ncbi:proteasome-interacting protein cic1, partial [Spiromyces aspiralis]
PLRHPIYEKETTDVCLLTKDPASIYQERVASNSLGFIKNVIGVSELQTKYKAFEKKRQLLTQYDLFVADERIMNLLPKLVGAKFFMKKKQPSLVDLTKTDIKKELEKALHSTYMIVPAGTCISIRIGRTSFSDKALAENIEYATGQVVRRLPRKWNNVQSISIKTPNSVALPIYNSLPDPSGMIDVNGIAKVGKPVGEEEEEVSTEQAVMERVQKAKTQDKVQKKGRQQREAGKKMATKNKKKAVSNKKAK